MTIPLNKKILDIVQSLAAVKHLATCEKILYRDMPDMRLQCEVKDEWVKETQAYFQKLPLRLFDAAHLTKSHETYEALMHFNPSQEILDTSPDQLGLYDFHIPARHPDLQHHQRREPDPDEENYAPGM